jgi:hypothetical protein
MTYKTKLLVPIEDALRDARMGLSDAEWEYAIDPTPQKKRACEVADSVLSDVEHHRRSGSLYYPLF